MRKSLGIALLVAFSVTATSVYMVTAGENPDGTMTIDHPAATWPAKKLKEGAKKKPPVTFNHKKHGELTDKKCQECHHTATNLTAADTSTAKSCFATDCHGPEAGTGEGGKVKPDSYKILHDKKLSKCKGCHSTEANKAAGAPQKCKQCHGE